jgi:hypothetical protein
MGVLREVFMARTQRVERSERAEGDGLRGKKPQLSFVGGRVLVST